jgi:hypothetical protein
MGAAGIAAFAALSAGIVVIHALSDVRITAVPKLPASLHLLLGAVLAFALIPALSALRARMARVPAILVAMPPLVLFALSANTTATMNSIATGQLDAYAARMTQRLEVLGAVRNEDVRLAPLPLCPFPSCVGEPIPASAAAWPAAYIAGLYGQRSVVTAGPQPQLPRRLDPCTGRADAGRAFTGRALFAAAALRGAAQAEAGARRPGIAGRAAGHGRSGASG